MTVVTVEIVADRINRKLSVVNPVQVAAGGDAGRTSIDDPNIMGRVMLESQQFADDSQHSVAEITAAVIDSIQAKFVLENATFILYLGSTDLVLSICCSVKLHKT